MIAKNSADVHPVKVTRPQHTHVRGKVLVDPPLILALQTFHPVDTDKIRSVIKDFLSRCSIPLLMTPFDNNFLNTCCEEAGRRGYPLDSFPAATSLRPFMVGGVVMATTAYAHLPLVRTRIFIAIYTAFLIYLDDVFQSRIDAVRGFNQRFIKKQPQGDAVLDAFAGFLHEFPAHFGLVASNIMVTATLNLVTALLLEQEMRNLTFSSPAHSFATFSRTMSGASEAYALFAFPSDLPLSTYIQALPEMVTFINNGNDILSFYKEDLAGESVNRISTLALCDDVPKIEIIQSLQLEAVNSDSKILSILAPHQEAHNAYKHFKQGYIAFHTSLSRYRLHELF